MKKQLKQKLKKVVCWADARRGPSAGAVVHLVPRLYVERLTEGEVASEAAYRLGGQGYPASSLQKRVLCGRRPVPLPDYRISTPYDTPEFTLYLRSLRDLYKAAGLCVRCATRSAVFLATPTGSPVVYPKSPRRQRGCPRKQA